MAKKKDMKKRLATDNTGFTLLELMIALGVLGIGLLAIISLHVNSIRENNDAMDMTEAGLANQSQIESFLLTPYDNINNDNPTTGDGYTGLTSADMVTIPQGFTLEYRVTNTIDLNADGTDDAKEVTIRVQDRDDDVKSSLTVIKTRI